jgi:hypothetical protein
MGKKSVGLIALFYILISFNHILTALALLAFALIIKLTWHGKKQVPIIFIAFTVQFFSISIKLFYANFLNLEFDSPELNRYPVHIVEAFCLSLAGLSALALGFYLTTFRIDYKSKIAIPITARTINLKKLTRLYIAIAIISPILYKISFSLGGLQQIVNWILNFKWSFFFLLMICSFVQNRKSQFLIITFIEILFSLTGFFSNFKDYFFILIIALMTLSSLHLNKLKAKNIFALSITIVISAYFILIWQIIKPEYRNYLNDGENKQTSVRGYQESLIKFYDLATDVSLETLSEGIDYTVDRLSYIDFLSATINNVPKNVPHTNGDLWFEAFKRVLQPRLFFPDKKRIDDSEKTVLYTGDEYRGSEDGVSISLGYFSETYVDFGKIGMLIALTAWGAIIGSFYSYLLKRVNDLLWAYSLLLPSFFILFSFEGALDKMVGAFFMYSIVCLLVLNLLLRHFKKLLEVH